MQTEIEKIAKLLQETANGDNWTGINAEQALQDISAAKAVNRINDKHLNIAELVSHLACWNKVIAKRLEGANYLPGKEEDFPRIDRLSEAEWETLKDDFIQSFRLLNEKLRSKQDSDIHQPIFEGASPLYRNVYGQIAHLHYHLGQIVLLKKLLN